MTPIERFLHALDRQPVDMVPLWDLEFHAWDAATGKHVVLGHEMERLSSLEQEYALQQNAEIFLTVAREFEFSAFTPPNAYWEQAPGELAYYVLPGETRYRQFEIVAELTRGEIALAGISGALQGANYDMDFCVTLFEAPEEIDAGCRRLYQEGLVLAERFRDLGVHAVVVAADIADNAGPFFNPAQMERFFLPYLHDYAAACHQMGMRLILHTDGFLPDAYLRLLAATGLDGLQAIDPVAGMDMATALDAVDDRLTLCGNIDCGLLLLGTPDDVYHTTRDLLTTSTPRGSIILGASNAVQPEVPIENYRAMYRAWKEYGGL